MLKEHWRALNNKAPGDSVALVVSGQWNIPDKLAEGTVIEVTPARRVFTIEGATQPGVAVWQAPGTEGVLSIDGRAFHFHPATPFDVERLACPDLRSALRQSLRSIAQQSEPHSGESLRTLIQSLETALADAKALLSELF